jgi:hypothetical protein
MTRRWIAAFAVAVGVAIGVSGCSTGSPGDINKTATAVLTPAVQHVREVAAIGNYADLRAAVNQLKDLVRQQEQAGNVSASRAAAIQDAADVLLQDGRTELSPSPTPTSETPSPTPTSETPSPTPTTESPTPAPTTTSPSPDVSITVGNGNGHGNGHTKTSSPASP